MRHQPSGFSIIELLIVLTIASIILAFGVPSFNSQIKNSRLTSSVNNLVGAMHLSRSEAGKRNTPVIICTSETALDAASESCTRNVDWNEGWLVFADNDRSGTLDSNDTIIQRQGVLSNDLFIIADEELSHSITYLPSGFALLPLNASSDRFIVYCNLTPKDDRFSRVLAVSNSGRPRILSPDRDENGAPTCEIDN